MNIHVLWFIHYLFFFYFNYVHLIIENNLPHICLFRMTMVVSLCKTSSHDTTVSLATNFRSRGNWLKSTGWLRYSISKIVDSLNLRMFWPHTRHRTPSFMGSHPNANGITIINTHNFSIFIFTSFQRVVSPGHRCLI